MLAAAQVAEEHTATVLLNSVACKRIRFRVTLRERRNSSRNVSDKRKSRDVVDKTLSVEGEMVFFFVYIFPTACGHVVRGLVNWKGI